VKRTTVQLEVELEGATVSGSSFVDWLTEIHDRLGWTYLEDRFRIVDAQVLSEDR